MRSSVVGVVVAVAPLIVSAGCISRSGSDSSNAFQPARTSDGKPDLNGI
jgi:hypothetical protein